MRNDVEVSLARLTREVAPAENVANAPKEVTSLLSMLAILARPSVLAKATTACVADSPTISKEVEYLK
jgi:hypothetical protein